MKKTLNTEAMAARIAALEALGFEICHQDSSVRVKVVDPTYGLYCIDVDFSAIAIEHFAAHAMKEIFREGRRIGRNQIRDRFHELMVVERSRGE